VNAPEKMRPEMGGNAVDAYTFEEFQMWIG
jgi:hypothetical protein